MQWKCDLAVKDLPRRFDFTHFDKQAAPWNVGSVVYPATSRTHSSPSDRHLQMSPPDTLKLSNCRWLCRDHTPVEGGQPHVMDQAVKAQFRLNWNGGVEPPEQVVLHVLHQSVCKAHMCASKCRQVPEQQIFISWYHSCRYFCLSKVQFCRLRALTDLCMSRSR